MADDPHPNPPSPSDTDVASGVASQWIIAGIISASARFIPIPFLDEIVQNRCRRYAVKTAIDSHTVDLQLSSLKPYYSNPSGCFTGCLGMMLKMPIKLLLFPFRKIILVVTSVRGVPLEIMRVYLLGRTLDRYLSDGRLGQSENSLRIDDKAYAARMGSAFEQSFSRMDMHVVLAAMKDATGGFTELGSAALVGLKSVFDRSNKSARAFVAEPEVKAEASRIQESFSQAEMVALFEHFDRRMDDALHGDSLDQSPQAHNSRGT
jgi:hypothetical protein